MYKVMDKVPESWDSYGHEPVIAMEDERGCQAVIYMDDYCYVFAAVGAKGKPQGFRALLRWPPEATVAVADYLTQAVENKPCGDPVCTEEPPAVKVPPKTVRWDRQRVEIAHALTRISVRLAYNSSGNEHRAPAMAEAAVVAAKIITTEPTSPTQVDIASSILQVSVAATPVKLDSKEYVAEITKAAGAAVRATKLIMGIEDVEETADV